jgi:uncharacterized protein YlxW (UPF0749 family)
MSEKTIMQTDDWLGWILGGIVSVIAALATAVTTLWSRSEVRNAEAIKELEKQVAECEKDRRALFGRVERLEEKVSHFETDHKVKKQDGV